MSQCPKCGAESRIGARFCDTCGASLAPAETGFDATAALRKTVTVVFCDVASSTSLGERLDPEALRHVLAQYFATMQRVIERYGGSVEKFIGDAVMAVFGVPITHEDDALRATRAALDMLAAQERLNESLIAAYGTELQIRIGVDTGEAVVGTEERLATGDVVNTAARLEQAAEPGQILIGEQTLRLARGSVEVEPIESLVLRGKAKPFRAYRLIATRDDADRSRRLDAPMVGRDSELSNLQDVFHQVVGNRCCRLYTVVGAAGVGKTRLTRELLRSVDGATVLSGRCLSYGDGVTYWPLVEALSRIASRLSELDLDPSAAVTIHGLLDGNATTSTDEIAWAFRKMAEALSVTNPLALVFDDIQWADDVLLDLIEQLVLLSNESPILVLCLARPELVDRRPTWQVTLRLAPLPKAETEHLLDRYLADVDVAPAIRSQILSSSGGNPLFLEEMTAMVQASGGTEVSVPPSIQALLAARIDQLEAGERSLLARAAVEGEVFHRGAVQALLAHEPGVAARLTALVRKDLLMPAQAQFPGEDAFRFRHLLVRDAAYESLPKVLRAELHERFAGWLEGKAAELLPEVEAIVGYHLEQAYLSLAALGPVDERASELGDHAGRRLGSAGNRMLWRGDGTAALALMERALRVTAKESPGHRRLLLRLGHALYMQGELQRGLDVLDDAVATAKAVGDISVELQAKIERARIASVAISDQGTTQMRELAEVSIPVFERLGDDEGLAKAWWAISDDWGGRLKSTLQLGALERSVEHSRRAGDDEQAIESETWMFVASIWGPTPASEMVDIAERARETGEPTPRREYWRLILSACAAALQGRFEAARESLTRAGALAEATSSFQERAGRLAYSATVEFIAGNSEEAERWARAAVDMSRQVGLTSFVSTEVGYLALALCALGRFEEAEQFANESQATSAKEDLISQILWRRALSKVLAERGEITRALELATEAAAMIDDSDSLNEHADALVDLAEILRFHGRDEDAIAQLNRALVLYEQKENVTQARVVKERLSLVAP